MPKVAPVYQNVKIWTIDLEYEEALQQRRRSFLEENRPNLVVKYPEREVAPIAGLSNGDISDYDTVIIEPVIEILDNKYYTDLGN